MSIIEARIRHELPIWRFMPPSRIEEEVAAQFVHPRHIRAIATAAEIGSFAVSFRAAGPATLACIEGESREGDKFPAPCKPHDVLGKTITKSSLIAAYGEKVGRGELEIVRECGIEGRAGHWVDNKLVGLHLSDEVRDFAVSNDPSERALATRLLRTPNGRYYYPVEANDLKRSLGALKAFKGAKSLILTGDYDMHDLINLASRASPVPQGSADEKKIIQMINAAIAAADESRPLDKPHMHVVQHGPQYSFVAYMKNEEPGHPIAGSVAEPKFPVAMCGPKGWRIIHTSEQHQAFYSELGMQVKSTWNAGSPGLEFRKLSLGAVELRRGSSSSTGTSGNSSSETDA